MQVTLATAIRGSFVVNENRTFVKTQSSTLSKHVFRTGPRIGRLEMKNKEGTT